MSDDVDAIVAAAWQRNRPMVLHRVDSLASAIAALRDGGISPEEHEEARSAAHKLAGSLGMYGFRSASVLAARIERVFDGGDDDLGLLADELAVVREELARESQDR